MKSKPKLLSRSEKQKQSWFQRLLRAINYDFCPNANVYVYWLKQPVGFVVLAIFASLLAGLFIGPQGFVLMWTFVALLIFGTVWPWLCLLRVECNLHFTEKRTHESVGTVARLEVVNRWPFPVYGMMVEGNFLQDVVEADDLIATGMQKIPAWSVSDFTWHVKPQRRGRIPVEMPEISTGFPFGILKRSRLISVPNQIIVWPKFVPLTGSLDPGDRSSSSGQTLTDLAGQDGDTIGVRDFREGDSIRHIHWPKTAQMNQLITRELQSSIRRTVRVLLDLSVASHSGVGSQSTYEMAIRVAATICSQLRSNQISVNLHCLGLSNDKSSQISTDRGIEVFLDFLAMLPSLEELSESDQIVNQINGVPPAKEKRELTILIATTESQIKQPGDTVTQTILIGESSIVDFSGFETGFALNSKNQKGIQLSDARVPSLNGDLPAGSLGT
ncbi:MAG: DUF58 domain-containing protein [Planctomycetota bacterium]|nr:DUF58 domain-containing protein [Planctomycetota bacterium]